MANEPTTTAPLQGNGLIKAIYNRTLRPVLLRQHWSRKYRIRAGVPVRDIGLLDQTEVCPDYKRGLASFVRDTVGPGQTVVEIGGGRGVMTVLAALSGAHVISYEPGEEMVEIMRETIDVCAVSDAVEIRQATVGTAINTYGNTSESQDVTPADLPECDGMILDCEGAEKSVFEQMNIRPEWIVVETHPRHGADIACLLKILQTDYELVSTRMLEPNEIKPVALFRLNTDAQE